MVDVPTEDNQAGTFCNPSKCGRDNAAGVPITVGLLAKSTDPEMIAIDAACLAAHNGIRRLHNMTPSPAAGSDQ